MEYRSSSSYLGLWVVRKLWQVPSQMGNNSGEGERSPSLGPDRSVALPGKTRGRLTPSIFIVSDPEVELIDSALALEVGSLPGLHVVNETALGRIDYPVAFIARGAHRREGSADLSDLVKNRRVFPLVGRDVQNLLAHIGQPVPARRHITLAASGSCGLSDIDLGG